VAWRVAALVASTRAGGRMHARTAGGLCAQRRTNMTPRITGCGNTTKKGQGRSPSGGWKAGGGREVRGIAVCIPRPAVMRGGTPHGNADAKGEMRHRMMEQGCSPVTRELVECERNGERLGKKKRPSSFLSVIPASW